MNQKDYKAIAEIIRTQREKWVNSKAHDIDGVDWVIMEYDITAEKLADYFEREEKHEEYCLDSNVDKILPQCICENRFNKQTFLKDCGVKE